MQKSSNGRDIRDKNSYFLFPYCISFAINRNCNSGLGRMRFFLWKMFTFQYILEKGRIWEWTFSCQRHDQKGGLNRTLQINWPTTRPRILDFWSLVFFVHSIQGTPRYLPPANTYLPLQFWIYFSVGVGYSLSDEELVFFHRESSFIYQKFSSRMNISDSFSFFQFLCNGDVCIWQFFVSRKWWLSWIHLLVSWWRNQWNGRNYVRCVMAEWLYNHTGIEWL